jgi:hypothetical protein
MLAVSADVIGWTGAGSATSGGPGTVGITSSKAYGAYLANKASYKALIAIKTRMPGKNLPDDNRIYRPTNHIAACRPRHGPTSFFFGSFLLIFSPSMMYRR